MPDTEISRLTELPAALVDDEDVLAIVDVSASETKKVKATSIVVAAIDDLPAGSIDWDKIDDTNFVLPADSVGEVHLQDGAVSQDKISDGAVTDSKIAAVDGSKITDGTVTDAKLAAGIDGAKLTDGTVSDSKISSLNGSKLVAGTVTDDALASGINGGKISDGTVDNDALASGIDGAKLTNGSTPVSKLDPAGFSDGIELDGTVKHTNEIVASTANGITFDAQGHITATGAIQATELPIATTDTVGAVSVPPESGLTVSGTGALDHADTIAPGTASKVTFNSHGHITATGTLNSADMPVATNTNLGAVIIPSTNDNPLSVDSSGNLTHNTSPVTPGEYVSVTVDNHGHVTNGSDTLSSSQIPELSADQITTGEFPTARLEDGSVTAPKLADYSTCLMQEDNPGAGDFLGQFWYTPSTAQLRVYARGSGPENIWLPVGFGALQANNLRWGGTYDAETDQLLSLTNIGVSEGLTAGSAFPAATAALSGMYFVCQVAGSNMTQPSLNGIAHSGGDWALCLDENQGWVHIDAVNGGGGGGGGGAAYLNDLLDVTIGGGASPFSTAPRIALSGDQILRYDGGAGVWRNTDIIDGGSID